MQEEINEELKMHNQLEWVGRINNLKNRINEIILGSLFIIDVLASNEFVYTPNSNMGLYAPIPTIKI